MQMFNDFTDSKDLNAVHKITKTPITTNQQHEVIADSGAMPVNRDDSSESSINSVKNKGDDTKLDSAR